MHEVLVGKTRSSVSSSSTDDSVRMHDYGSVSEITYKEAAESIKDGNASSNIRELVLTLHRSSPLREIVPTVCETMIAINDTTKEINDIVKDLNESGIINDIASAVEETTNTVRKTIQVAKDEIRS